jgi:hypothetical protein
MPADRLFRHPLARHSHALLCLDGAFFELNGRGVPLLPLLS